VVQPFVHLTSQIANLPSYAVATTAQVAVQLVNSGNTAARGAVALDLYASVDGAVDSSATLLTGLTRHVNLSPGQSVLIPVRFQSPSVAGGWHL